MRKEPFLESFFFVENLIILKEKWKKSNSGKFTLKFDVEDIKGLLFWKKFSAGSCKAENIPVVAEFYLLNSLKKSWTHFFGHVDQLANLNPD